MTTPGERATGTVLDEIVAARRRSVQRARRAVSLPRIRARAESAPPAGDFGAALSAPGMSIITEMKRASASAGSLAPGLDPSEMAAAFVDGGAAAISVLTEPDYFSGSLADLQAAKRVAAPRGVPVMQKDFVVSEYQVYEAAAHGADAVLLIVAILEPGLYADLIDLARRLGLGTLVEVFTTRELDAALIEDPPVIGINNRNLRTLKTDLTTFEKLAPLVPGDKLLVAESGMGNADDVRRMERAGARAVLVGESLMRAGRVRDSVRALTGSIARGAGA